MAKPVDRIGGKPVYNNASPGISGAIKDAVGALARAAAPRSITQAAQREDQEEDAAEGDDDLGRMKAAQSTDRDNSYSY